MTRDSRTISEHGALRKGDDEDRHTRNIQTASWSTLCRNSFAPDKVKRR
jgi:hypothetical protein